MRSKPRNFELNIYGDLGVVKSTRSLFLHNMEEQPLLYGGSYVLKDLALVITDKKYVMILPKTTNGRRLVLMHWVSSLFSCDCQVNLKNTWKILNL